MRISATELELSKADVRKLADFSRRMIQVIAGVLALGFAWVVVTESQVITILNQSDPGIFYKVGLFLYYTSWIFGAKFDVDIEERVYIADLARGLMDWKSLGVLALFTVVMVFFFWLHQYERFFGLGLLAFVLTNILGWKAVCRRIAGTIDDSRSRYRDLKDHFGLEKLAIVSEYMRGRWQVHRFAAMLAMAVALIAATNALLYFQLDRTVAGLVVQGLPAERLVQLAPAALFVVYVLIAEGWIWLKRMNAYHAVNVLDELAEKFNLRPRRAIRATAPDGEPDAAAG